MMGGTRYTEGPTIDPRRKERHHPKYRPEETRIEKPQTDVS